LILRVDHVAEIPSHSRRRNGIPMGKSKGLAGPNTSKSARNPQRIVLLAGDEHNDVKSVLAEYQGANLEKVDVNEEIPKFATEHPRKWVAVEWQVAQGWRRFPWCRR
jgi:hypothetical protein